jgi:hypothetical protein
MTTPYDKFKDTEEWLLVERAIQDLIQNKDIHLATHRDYVVGYITKQLFNTRDADKH